MIVTNGEVCKIETVPFVKDYNLPGEFKKPQISTCLAIFSSSTMLHTRNPSGILVCGIKANQRRADLVQQLETAATKGQASTMNKNTQQLGQHHHFFVQKQVDVPSW